MNDNWSEIWNSVMISYLVFEIQLSKYKKIMARD